MDAGDLGLYRLRYEQMDAVRDAHRDTRRFHIALNISGVSALLGVYGQVGEAGPALFAAALLGLALMCAVWFSTSSDYSRRYLFRARALLDLEARLGVAYFREELIALQNRQTPMGFPVDRLSAALLGLFYAGAAAMFAIMAPSDIRNPLEFWRHVLQNMGAS